VRTLVSIESPRNSRELAGTVTVEVEFIVTDEESKRLLAVIEAAKIRLFYAIFRLASM
jgi:hypothetical protein